MIKLANYYVTKNPDGTWDAKRENADRASGIFQTQQDAEIAAKEFSANSGGGEVRIQGRDNKFIDSDTVAPGNDPNPPKDKIH